MNKKLWLYMLSCIAIFVPTPAHLGIGIELLILMNILVALLLCAKFGISFLSIEKYEPVLLLICSVGISILLFQILTLFSPITAFTLNFVFYLMPISAILLGMIIPKKNQALSLSFKETFRNLFIFTSLGFLFYFIREILSYGYLTLPGRTILHIIPLFPYETPNIFWASIPGGLVLSACIWFFLSFIHRKLDIVKRSGC
jgi:hypothetical protein